MPDLCSQVYAHAPQRLDSPSRRSRLGEVRVKELVHERRVPVLFDGVPHRPHQAHLVMDIMHRKPVRRVKTR